MKLLFSKFSSCSFYLSLRILAGSDCKVKFYSETWVGLTAFLLLWHHVIFPLFSILQEARNDCLVYIISHSFLPELFHIALFAFNLKEIWKLSLAAAEKHIFCFSELFRFLGSLNSKFWRVTVDTIIWTICLQFGFTLRFYKISIVVLS